MQPLTRAAKVKRASVAVTKTGLKVFKSLLRVARIQVVLPPPLKVAKLILEDRYTKVA